MANLFADEDFDFFVVRELRHLGHDVLTVMQAGLAGKKTPDPVILAFATKRGRAVLTHDNDFIILHKRGPVHAGIVYCTCDRNRVALAKRIDDAIRANLPLNNKLLRVYKPAKP